MKTVKLTKLEIDLKDELTWGDIQDLEAIVMSGAELDNKGLRGFDASVMLTSKFKLLEIAITEIREDGKKINFSEDLIRNLSFDDGKKLYSEVEGLKGVSEAIRIKI